MNIALFERDVELGGIPRSCHFFFGMRDQKRIYTGPAYAKKLSSLIRSTSVKLHLGTMVLSVVPGISGEAHRIDVLSPEGLKSYSSRFVILATGCFESSRHARQIPGTRPSGIYTTGTLQQLVNLGRFEFRGRRAVIIGSELVALSSVLTLKKAGASVIAMVEEDPELHSYAYPAEAMARLYHFPIFKDTAVHEVFGDERVEGVGLLTGQRTFQMDCDMVIITGRFRPESTLIDNTPIQRDPASSGPSVNLDLMTSAPNILAAGNILRGADMHDLCALEGKLAAQSILRTLESDRIPAGPCFTIRAEPPIRYVVPQRINPRKIGKGRFCKLYPCPAFQLKHTRGNTIMEAVSGAERIWEGAFHKLIANSRYPLPVEKFRWNRADPYKEVTLKIAPC